MKINNKASLEFFSQMANENNLNPNSVKLAKNSDFSTYDSDFIMQYTNQDSEILDLATGTGLIINKIAQKVKKIVAVEAFENFTKFIIKSDNIKIIHENVYDYIPEQKFDLITIFALMHYLNEEEAVALYKKYIPFLKPKGKIIIKNQFGVKEDVNISGYSEELKKDYYAQYRHIDKEVKILLHIGYKNVKVVDIYPPECNRWSNTHFYAIIGEKS